MVEIRKTYFFFDSHLKRKTDKELNQMFWILLAEMKRRKRFTDSGINKISAEYLDVNDQAFPEEDEYGDLGYDEEAYRLHHEDIERMRQLTGSREIIR